MSKRNITISEIAKLAGVSKTTVSRVLNNKPDVLPETRERIRAIIDDLDYCPSIFAKAISNRKSNTIGLLIPYSTNYILSNPYYYEVIRGITIELNKQGYYVLIMHNQDNNYRIALKQNRVDGVIVISPGSGHEDIFDTIISYGIPVVATSRILNVEGVSYIDIDNVYGATLAVEHLVSQGHRNIGFINGPEILQSSKDRFLGYLNTLKKHNIPFKDNLVKIGDTSIISGYKSMKELLWEKDLTAVFVASDLMAVGVINAINEVGKKVPDDLSIVGFDDIPLAGDLNPPLTTIRQYAFEKGELSARMLIDIIEEGQASIKESIKTDIVIRGSTRSLK
jgi:LacI family transcriptional regulator